MQRKIPKSLKEKVYTFPTHTANFKKFVNAPQTSDWALVFFIRKVYVWNFKENLLQAPMYLPKIQKTRVYFCINIFSAKRGRTYTESETCQVPYANLLTQSFFHTCVILLFSVVCKVDHSLLFRKGKIFVYHGENILKCCVFFSNYFWKFKNQKNKSKTNIVNLWK